LRTAGSKSALVNVWPLMVTICVGAAGVVGCAAAGEAGDVGRAAVGDADVADAFVADLFVADAGGFAGGCDVVTGARLRLVVGVRFVWPSEADERANTTMRGKRVTEDFILELML
jgi:hypothetical protein